MHFVPVNAVNPRLKGSRHLSRVEIVGGTTHPASSYTYGIFSPMEGPVATMLSRRILYSTSISLLRLSSTTDAANVTRFVAVHQRAAAAFERRVNTEFAGLNGTKVVDEVVLRNGNSSFSKGEGKKKERGKSAKKIEAAYASAFRKWLDAQPLKVIGICTTGGGVEMQRARECMHLGVGGTKGEERGGGGGGGGEKRLKREDRTRNTGRRREGRSSTRTGTRNVKPEGDRRRVPRCNDAAFRRMLNVHFPNSESYLSVNQANERKQNLR
ncbi:hypothetical protein DBV15_07540 [Temnothorax longispinosus]|uniref:Uncharacterized protein n=1 Tax=Temnothorax longispinosus TaxID=300112 RepID=A0A4S2K001_9HYME|nr:hypothetical protein DBV15_07540 [Temnothorax longispinosus]